MQAGGRGGGGGGGGVAGWDASALVPHCVPRRM